MRFSWDASKNARNIQERGLSFAEAAPMRDGPMLVWIDIGWVRRGADDIHIFSFRKANGRETKRYQAALAEQGGSA